MSEHPLKRPSWFSCRIDGAEGDDEFLRLRGRVDQQEDGLAGGGERREDRQAVDDGPA